MREGMKGEGMVFGSIEEVQFALDNGDVHLHARITARIPQIDEHGIEIEKRFETTPGRVRIGALLPKNAKAFAFFGSRAPIRTLPGVVSKRFSISIPCSSICGIRAVILACKWTSPLSRANCTSSIEPKTIPSPFIPSRMIVV